jgi:hypothetical protein
MPSKTANIRGEGRRMRDDYYSRWMMARKSEKLSQTSNLCEKDLALSPMGR